MIGVNLSSCMRPLVRYVADLLKSQPHAVGKYDQIGVRVIKVPELGLRFRGE